MSIESKTQKTNHIQLYNTLSRQKEPFVPMHENKVRMYVCGPTVYDLIHIGNARPLIVFDALRRYLEYKGFDVCFVQNFTDVDDKIIQKANDEQVDTQTITNRYINEFYVDSKGLSVKPATVNPKVTEEMDSIINMIVTLMEKGFAYEKNGTVYFDTSKVTHYGKLSKKILMIWKVARGLQWMKKRKTVQILYSGNPPNLTNPNGNHHLVKGARAGILNVL